MGFFWPLCKLCPPKVSFPSLRKQSFEGTFAKKSFEILKKQQQIAWNPGKILIAKEPVIRRHYSKKEVFGFWKNNSKLLEIQAKSWKITVKGLHFLLRRYFQGFCPNYWYTFSPEQLSMAILGTSWSFFLYIKLCTIRAL